MRRAHAVHPVTAVQTEYSLWERGVEQDVLPVTAQLGIGFVPYSPLGRGFLGGALSDPESLEAGDWRRNDPRYDADNFERNKTILAEIRLIADRKKVSLARIALAWLLAKRPDIVPIPGTKRRVTMADSMAACDVDLAPEDMTALDALSPAAGLRGRPQALSSLNV